MAENSKIEWTDYTFNPWEGCQKVGPGCDHCYAEARNARFGGGQAINWGPGAPRRRTSAANWRKPLQWNRHEFFQCDDCGKRGFGVPWEDFGPNMGKVDDGYACEACGSRSMEPVRMRVFCASLADVFDNAVDPQWRYDLWQLIQDTPNLDWLLLTKRIGNVYDMLPDGWALGHGAWPNVWLGATVVNQEEADRDIPKLLAVPAKVRFLSMEPLLGPVDLGQWFEWRDTIAGSNTITSRRSLSWVIVGGESGHRARPMHPNLARDIRDQCTAAGAPFLFKQWGEWLPFDQREAGQIRDSVSYEQNGFAWKVGKKIAGRLLDGHLHDGYPEIEA